MSAITATQLATALGAFNRVNKDLLFRNILLGLNIGELFTVMDGVKDELPMPNLTIADIVQPGNNTVFNPTVGALAFGAEILKVRNWKVDLRIDPNILEKTWLGQAVPAGTGVNQKRIPFEQYVMEYIVQKVQENIRLQAIFKGVYNAAGTTPPDIMTGTLKIIADAITASKLTPIVTGAITATNVVDKLLLVHDGLSEPLKATPTQMPVNSTIFDWYTRKFTPVINTGIVVGDAKAAMTTPMMNQAPLVGTNCTIYREPGLGTSQRIEVTTKANRIFGCDTMAESNNIEAEKFERIVKLMMDGKAGVGYALLNDQAMRVNEQA